MAFVSAASVSTLSVDLTLADAVYLGLRDNRSIRSAYLQRVVQKFDLRVVQDAFRPQAEIISKYVTNRGHEDRHRDYSLTPSAKLLNEWGTQFSLSWTQHFNQANQHGRKRDNGLAFEVVQPLLKGAGREIVTAPVRLARLSEQHNQLLLKATVSQTVTQIVSAYRELLKAQEQQRIAQTALTRSRQLLEVNKALIASGRMAEFESVQTEADLASQELGVEETANQLDQSRLALLELLALDQGTRLRASEVLKVERLEMDRQQALRVAQAQQPKYLQLMIAGEQAEINLRVAQNSRLWDVSLIGGASQSSNRPGTKQRYVDRAWRSYAGIQLSMPIGDLTARQRAVTAQVAVESHAIERAKARQVLEQSVSNGIRDMSTRWRQYEIAQRVRQLSQRKLDIERDKLQLGRSSNFQVLSFEADLRRADNATLNAQIAYLNAQTQLDESLGMTLHSWEIALND
ncbi:TolC family protein [Pseudomonas sp. 10B1]|uniref:TolC family protein n=1 Tax=unclassified Pseudomonas TaxID=196821 RepID=UPI002AB55295|nr:MULTISPECIES: TolC family protein [unclassified Pseudomonas]MDY7561504.1 TolC family protein [Pseudomonas sp. AB6]MEA9976719.1 TolC family protein [Pseudomonas sp. RTS4]MEA9994944.1 TolC family protein [Pseudomonas sp. AA4]MEB0088299.1 TolC family protein [Pseudomonas sp. RTI1]MEB0127110.1 TolC family protein [Pseudomonas sp. CCC1.2]